LRWSDVDFRLGHVSIRQAVTVVDGEEVVAAPKTRRSRRTIDIDADTAALLEAHRQTQSDVLARVDLTGAFDDRVFANDVGDPMRPDSVGQAFHRLVDKAGVPVIRLHDLRHTHASHLLAAGINVKVVSERLGHASVSFTLDTYGHVMPGQQAEAAAAAAGLLVIK